MVLFTPEKLIFKGSKKQHQILAQTAYYQAGKIVVQTILPEQPPVALITLNTLGTTCSTSADTYIPIENIFNTQSCSSLESRLVSLYGGKAASLLIEYEQRLKFLNKNNNSGPSKEGLTKQSSPSTKMNPVASRRSKLCKEDGTILFQRGKKLTKPKRGKRSQAGTATKNNVAVSVRSQVFNFSELTPAKMNPIPPTKRNPHTLRSLDPLTPKGYGFISVGGKGYRVHFSGRSKEWKPNGKAHLVRTCFAGAGNNIFQSTLGNIEIRTATRLARIMVNYWNFYSLNKISLYSLVKKYAPAHDSSSLLRIPQRSKSLFAYPSTKMNPHTLRSLDPEGFISVGGMGYGVRGQQLKDQKQKDLSYILKEESVAKELEAERDAKRKCNVRVWGIKLKVKDKTPQGNIIYKIAKLNLGCKANPPLKWTKGYGVREANPPLKWTKGYGAREARNNLCFAIAQSKNSLKICENKNSSYNIRRLSIENIGNYSQLNNNNFQLINSLQFSHLQRDRFYPNWFRLYLPDMEPTEFLKNIANYYFSLGLQTLTFPSTKSSYSLSSSRALGKLNFNTANPFLSFLNKNTPLREYKYHKEKYKLFLPNISSYTYCPPTILINSPSVKSINLRNKLTSGFILAEQDKLTLGSGASEQDKWYFSQRNTIWVAKRRINFSGARDLKAPSFTKVEGVRLDTLNVPFSLLLESQIFPLNYNGFSIVEKELLYNTLVNSSFAKAFYLINQNRQLLDFFVDYLLRFQILRQHQILYLFSTLLLGCYKMA